MNARFLVKLHIHNNYIEGFIYDIYEEISYSFIKKLRC